MERPAFRRVLLADQLNALLLLTGSLCGWGWRTSPVCEVIDLQTASVCDGCCMSYPIRRRADRKISYSTRPGSNVDPQEVLA